MSALAYAEDADCGNSAPMLTRTHRDELEAYLKKRGWEEQREFQYCRIPGKAVRG